MSMRIPVPVAQSRFLSILVLLSLWLLPLVSVFSEADRKDAGLVVTGKKGQPPLPTSESFSADTMSATQLLAQMVKKDRWIILPDNARNTQFDIVICIALFYTALVTPYEVALLGTALNVRFGINMFVDFLYFIDMIRQFFIAYENPVTRVIIKSHAAIAKHYFKTWFIIDFASILPFDTIALLLNNESLQKAKALKAVRLLRIFKLFKIVRALNMIKKYRARFNFSQNVLFGWVKLGQLLFILHFFACAWLLTATIECDNECMMSLPEDERAGQTWLASASDGAIWTPYKKYVAGLYWGAMTITSVGYGDIYPLNDSERIVCVALLVMSGLYWASLVGDICAILSTLDVSRIEFRQKMDQLNSMMTDIQVPYDLQCTIREYYYEAGTMSRVNRYRGLIAMMSPTLRGRLSRYRCKNLIIVRYFREGSNEFLGDIAERLTSHVFAPNEWVVMEGYLMILNKGVALSDGRVMSRGSVWGEDFILTNKDLRLSTVVVAFTYVMVHALSKENLEEALRSWPNEQKMVRKEVLKLALLNGIRLVSGVRQKMRKNQRRTSLLRVVSDRFNDDRKDDPWAHVRRELANGDFGIGDGGGDRVQQEQRSRAAKVAGVRAASDVGGSVSSVSSANLSQIAERLHSIAREQRRQGQQNRELEGHIQQQLKQQAETQAVIYSLLADIQQNQQNQQNRQNQQNQQHPPMQFRNTVKFDDIETRLKQGARGR